MDQPGRRVPPISGQTANPARVDKWEANAPDPAPRSARRETHSRLSFFSTISTTCSSTAGLAHQGTAVLLASRVAEVAREHGGHPPKSLDSDKIFKPDHTLFCRESRFVAIYALFGDLWATKSAFLGQKQCFLGKKCTITWYILHILMS